MLSTALIFIQYLNLTFNVLDLKEDKNKLV